MASQSNEIFESPSQPTSPSDIKDLSFITLKDESDPPEKPRCSLIGSLSKIGGLFSENKKYLQDLSIATIYTSNNFMAYYKGLAEFTSGLIPDDHPTAKYISVGLLGVLCLPLLSTTFKTIRTAQNTSEQSEIDLLDQEEKQESSAPKNKNSTIKGAAALIKTAGVSVSTAQFIDNNISSSPVNIAIPASVVAVVNFLVNLASFKYTPPSEEKPLADSKSKGLLCKKTCLQILSATFSTINNGFYVPDFQGVLQQYGTPATLSWGIPTLIACLGLPSNYASTLSTLESLFNVSHQKQESRIIEELVKLSSKMLALLKSVGAATSLMSAMNALFQSVDGSSDKQTYQQAIIITMGIISILCNYSANKTLQARGITEIGDKVENDYAVASSYDTNNNYSINN